MASIEVNHSVLREVAQDEVIKTEVSEDMYEVPNVYVAAEYEVDPDTGEVVKAQEGPAGNGDGIDVSVE